jgi:hypothetical protein
VRAVISRDDGATFSTNILTENDQGMIHRVAPVLTGTPENLLRVRIFVSHPARLYGWGVSWF